jgi:hypothetical protein
LKDAKEEKSTKTREISSNALASKFKIMAIRSRFKILCSNLFENYLWSQLCPSSDEG